MRVLDLFREFDTDGSGRVDKPEWRAAWKTIGPNFPVGVVDEAFDIFDPDKSGTIEFGELDKLLRRKASDMWASLKQRKNGATSPPADQTDAEGLGRGEFKSNMQIKADDFYEADKDGNTELEYDEFVTMLRTRDAKAEPPVERSEVRHVHVYVRLIHIHVYVRGADMCRRQGRAASRALRGATYTYVYIYIHIDGWQLVGNGETHLHTTYTYTGREVPDFVRTHQPWAL